MKIECDLHTHTIASGHAYGTIREMAQAADEMDLKLLGITEHAPGIPGTINPFYYNNLSVIPRTLYGVEIVHGCEINVLNDGSLSLEQSYIDHLDYAIVGIHVQCYEDQGRERNTDHLVSCMKNEKVHIVSHPDDDHTPLDYERLVLAAKEYQVALEVNNSSFLKKPEARLNMHENYRTMLGLCQRHRVPIVVNSDAHDPSYVGHFEKAIEFIEACGFDEQLILNTSSEAFKKFIGK